MPADKVICREDRGKGPPGCGAFICASADLFRDAHNNLCVDVGACPSAHVVRGRGGQVVLGDGGTPRFCCGMPMCTATIGVQDLRDSSIINLAAPKKVSIIIASSSHLPLTKKNINKRFKYPPSDHDTSSEDDSFPDVAYGDGPGRRRLDSEGYLVVDEDGRPDERPDPCDCPYCNGQITETASVATQTTIFIDCGLTVKAEGDGYLDGNVAKGGLTAPEPDDTG